GLPPTVAELDVFLRDDAPDAYERMVERYLASPHYGERWGKFWLDAAGYSDSNGYFNADSDRPLAWKYRDYVVRNFNADRPYDQFVREQLAGDELVGYRPDRDVTPAMVEGLVATHFLRNAPDGTGESDGNPDEVRTDRFTVLEGNVQNVANCLLGLTVQCARCHDHKFEPISQKEYYGLQALLFPVYNPDRWSKPDERVVQVGVRSDLAARQRLSDQIDRQVKAAQAGLAAFAEPLREQLLDERLKDLADADRSAVLDALRTSKEKRTRAQADLLKTHAKLVEVTDDVLAERFPEYGRLRDQVKQTAARREKDRPRPAEAIAAFVETDPRPPAHHVLQRGQHGQPGEEVQPGVLGALSTANNRFTVEPPADGRVSTGRRTAFARWVTAPENPLFARVMVNRIWQHHFGTGIVATADNLGASGAKPSHPDLLDFLAAEFERSGWSVKAIHRLILTSAVYRQSSAPREKLDALDPDNRLLTRFPLRRLDAEAVRDGMLHVAGELDTRAGGPYVPSKRTPEGTVEVAENTDGAHRRSIYLQQRRTQVVTFLQLFDAPAIVTTCGKRTPSTVPLQSLVLLNSEFARARGKAFAARLAREAGGDPARRLDLGFRLACGRPPQKEERALCESFLGKQFAVYAGEKDADLRAWADLCQMLLASNAFLYAE
ncbi:MAG TPA: DUF1549 and DUF1553 domain-containing protein, partial [Gemmataceae bacterium]|nr:DUF1549 and DUF1553 domain-containing protein [Gemmataceae bacterium]